MRLTDSLEILMDTVKYGENLTPHKNLLIGLFGLTPSQKGGVID
jgi:hypothetical protein